MNKARASKSERQGPRNSDCIVMRVITIFIGILNPDLRQ